MPLIFLILFYKFKLGGSGNVPFLVLVNILVGHVVPMRAVRMVCCGK